MRVDRRVGDGGERRGDACIVEQRAPGPRAWIDEVERAPVGAGTGHLVVESHAVAEPDRVDAAADQERVERADAIGFGVIDALRWQARGQAAARKCRDGQ